MLTVGFRKRTKPARAPETHLEVTEEGLVPEFKEREAAYEARA